MNLNDLFNEEKVRLDPKCWTGKKIGNPKTKMKGGVRVNNCVPAESVEELNEVDRNKPFDMNRPLPGDPRLAQWQHNHPVEPIQIDPLGLPGGGGRMAGNMSRNIATQRNVGGKEIPSLGQSGKVVTSPTMDKVLTNLGGKTTSTGPGPTVKSGSTNVQIDPAAEVPAYVRQGKPDPVTTKPKISVKPGETMDQAMQRTKAEQEFGKFLQGQGGQKFGPGAGRGTVNPETTKPASNAPKELTIDPTTIGSNVKSTGTKELTIDPNSWGKPLSNLDRFKQEHLRNPWYPGEENDWAGQNALANQARQNAIKRSSDMAKKADLIQPLPSKWKNRDNDVDLEEQSRKKREQPEANYDDEYDAMVARVKKLAGLGPMKTVYDPNKRQYRNMPTAVQPKK